MCVGTQLLTHYDLKFVYQMYTSTQSEEQHLHTTLDLFD